MRSCASLACVLALISGCAYSNQERVARNNLTRSHLRGAADERAAKCERLIDEMAATQRAAASQTLASQLDNKSQNGTVIDPMGFSRPQFSSADSSELQELDTSTGMINFGH